MNTALILGVTGQDGALLARHLLAMGYTVHGTHRNPTACTEPPAKLARLGIAGQVVLHRLDVRDAPCVAALFDTVRPDEIYHLAAPSSVGLSFRRPRETTACIVDGILNVLNAQLRHAPRARLFNAASGECFGDTGVGGRATLDRPFRPRSPYGAAKAATAEVVQAWRSAFGLWACSGFLFNHESPLRSTDFVSQKIVLGALAIARGDRNSLSLGDLSVVRDWGWAADYVIAMHRMLQQPEPRDLVLATGKGQRLEDYVDTAFALHGLDWRAHVRCDPELWRSGEAAQCVGDPSEAADAIGWRASVVMPEVVERLTAAARVQTDTGQPGRQL